MWWYLKKKNFSSATCIWIWNYNLGPDPGHRLLQCKKSSTTVTFQLSPNNMSLTNIGNFPKIC
jgi:hypothetical protein